MMPKTDTKLGTCGCGRSPTGDCCGWHALTEQEYQHKLMLYREDQFRKDEEEEGYIWLPKGKE